MRTRNYIWCVRNNKKKSKMFFKLKMRDKQTFTCPSFPCTHLNFVYARKILIIHAYVSSHTYIVAEKYFEKNIKISSRNYLLGTGTGIYT